MRGWPFALAALILAPPAAAEPNGWSTQTAAGRLTASVERGSLAIALQLEDGRQLKPPVLRIDVPALVRDRVKGRFPGTVRAENAKRPRITLPLAGPLRFADPDRNDGMLRVEFRHCPADSGPCGVDRVDIPVRAGP